MADKNVKIYQKSHSSGIKQPGSQTTIRGPVYEEPYTPYNRGMNKKELSNGVSGTPRS